MSVGERIKRRREELSLSQGDLAKIMNVSRQAISKAELHDNNITTEKVRKFAKALGVSEFYLMGWDDEPITMNFEEGSDFQHIEMYKNLLDEDKETVNRVIASLYNKKVSE